MGSFSWRLSTLGFASRFYDNGAIKFSTYIITEEPRVRKRFVFILGLPRLCPFVCIVGFKQASKRSIDRSPAWILLAVAHAVKFAIGLVLIACDVSAVPIVDPFPNLETSQLHSSFVVR